MSDTPSVDMIREQAAYWALRLEDDAVTEHECEEFRKWVSRPAHQDAFLAQVAIGTLASELTLTAHTRGLHVVPGESSTPTSTSPIATTRAPKRLRYAAIAASVLFIAVTATWFFGSPWTARSQWYVTGTRELRTVVFEDGSTATINTRSELRWVGGPRDRRVVLKRGEALFNVVPDSARPFRVLVGDLDEIRVVGTQFNVYRKVDGTIIVSVLDGKVEITHRDSAANVVWSQHVSANQQIRYRTAGLPVIRNTAASKAVRWRQGELEIEDDPLPDVLAELGRYTDQRIELVPDPRLTRMHVGGVLSVNDIDSALTLLERRVPIQVTQDRKTGAYTLSYREKYAPESLTDSTTRR